MANQSLADLFGDAVVFSYTRAEALADGVLVDVSPRAREAGFRIPLALTHAAWQDCVAWTADDSLRLVHQDETGRLWDVLTLAYWTIRWCRQADNPLLFDVNRVARDGQSTLPVLTTLKFVLGPGDAGEPVGTIMLPDED